MLFQHLPGQSKHCALTPPVASIRKLLTIINLPPSNLCILEIKLGGIINDAISLLAPGCGRATPANSKTATALNG